MTTAATSHHAFTDVHRRVAELTPAIGFEGMDCAGARPVPWPPSRSASWMDGAIGRLLTEPFVRVSSRAPV